MISHRRILLVFRLAVGAVFIWAGIVKIADPVRFAQDIANYRVFPQGLVVLLAAVMPWIEVFCGLFLIAGLFRASSSLILSGLLVGFLILIVSTMVRGIDVECGCFGSLSRKVDVRLLLTDGVLLFMSLNVFKAALRPGKTQG